MVQLGKNLRDEYQVNFSQGILFGTARATPNPSLNLTLCGGPILVSKSIAQNSPPAKCRLAQTLYVSNSGLIATELTWHLIVQRLRLLETSWSVARTTSSRSPQHSAHHALGAGRPSFGGRRTCAASQPPQFSIARILQTLAVRQRSYQYPAPQAPSRFLQA